MVDIKIHADDRANIAHAMCQVMTNLQGARRVRAPGTNMLGVRPRDIQTLRRTRRTFDTDDVACMSFERYDIFDLHSMEPPAVLT
jgi:hypothetical protein